jgi:hypothetical protein
VHPGDREAARPGAERARHRGDDRVDRGGFGLVVETDAPNGHAVQLLTQTQRLVGRVEVVLGRDHLVARLEAETRVDEPEPHRRRVGERDLLRLAAEVRRGSGAGALLQLRLRLAEVQGRIRVERAAVALDRVPDDARVRGE